VTDARVPAPSGPEEAPPFGGTWSRLYLLVAVNLLVWIAVFAVFTWAFR
jgi:hypothetical protein